MNNVLLVAEHEEETRGTSIGVRRRKYYPKYTSETQGIRSSKTKYGGATSYVQYDSAEEKNEIRNPIQNHEL